MNGMEQKSKNKFDYTAYIRDVVCESFEAFVLTAKIIVISGNSLVNSLSSTDEYSKKKQTKKYFKHRVQCRIFVKESEQTYELVQ